MKRFGFFTFLVLTTFLQNCDNGVRLSKSSPMYNSKVHITALTETDQLPDDVKTLLSREGAPNKDSVKFPLAYYLIQKEDIKVLYSPYFDPNIVAQLYLEVSGTRYYKLFVHPDNDKLYSFLQHAYRYIGPEDTEFFATQISMPKTLVVWSRTNKDKKPFLVRTNLDGKGLNIENARIPAGLPSGEQSVQMIFYRQIKGSKEPLEGQQVTRVPQFSR